MKSVYSQMDNKVNGAEIWCKFNRAVASGFLGHQLFNELYEQYERLSQTISVIERQMFGRSLE